MEQDTKEYYFGDKPITQMTDQELLAAVQANKNSPSYPNSTTTILVSLMIERLMQDHIDQASATEEINAAAVDDLLAMKGSDDSGNE